MARTFLPEPSAPMLCFHPLRFLVPAVLAGVLTSAASLSTDLQAAPEGVSTLEIGAQAPDFSLPGIDGRTHTLADYADKAILAVLFTCNHCPSAQAVEARIKALVERYADQSFQLVAISPNDPEAVRLNELGYSVYGDTLEEMKAHAEDNEFNFPYLYDGDEQAAAKAYGPTATPHLFLFDKARKLRYVGRVDDSKYADPEGITRHDAREAIDALLAGQPVEVEKTRAHGCSTKWADKREAVAKYEAEHKAREVTQEGIDAKGVKALVANETDKVRLINLWASYCGPCLAEMPELVKVGRQFETRGFDLIFISVDAEAMQDQALRLLKANRAAMPRLTAASVEEEGRTTNNYLFQGSTDELAEALDPDWDGSVPYTVVLAPGGEVIYKHTDGEVDPLELRRKIVGFLGRTYTPKPEKP